MRTSIDLPETTLERARQLAASRGLGVDDYLRDLVVRLLSAPKPPASTEPYRMITFGHGGLRPGVSLEHGALHDLLDEEARDPATGKTDLDKLR